MQTTDRYNILCHIWFSLFFFKPMEKLEPQCADLLHLDCLFHCLEEPNNHCCSHTALCDEGLQVRGGGRGEGFILNLNLYWLQKQKSEFIQYKHLNLTFRMFFLNSHHSSSCRWIFSDLLQCNKGDRGWTWQTVGRGTSGSLCLWENKAGWRTCQIWLLLTITPYSFCSMRPDELWLLIKLDLSYCGTVNPSYKPI